MTGADLLLTALALGAAILLARGSHPVAAVLLVMSALVVSAALFLPTSMLTGWLGRDRIGQLYGLARGTWFDPPEWIHFFAFAWLGLLIYLARRDLRNWRGFALVVALGLIAELMQWLTDGREPMLEDAALNVVAGLLGMSLVWVCCKVAVWVRRGGRPAGGGSTSR